MAIQDVVLYLHEQWQALKNGLSFFVRNQCRWSRGVYQEPAESKDNLFQGATQDQASALISRYRLQALEQCSTRSRFLETLSYLEFIEHLTHYQPVDPTSLNLSQRPLRWLDAGAKNWSYVEAIYRYLETRHPAFELVGIELDGYRLYTDLHNRADYAQSYIRSLPKAEYVVQDVLSHQASYHVISSFLPFVFKAPFLAWGLPLKYFEPFRYLQHLYQLLEPGGVLLILNQGVEEAKEQERLLNQLKTQDSTLLFQPLGMLPSSFLEYTHPRYGFACTRQKVVHAHPDTGHKEPQQVDGVGANHRGAATTHPH